LESVWIEQAHVIGDKRMTAGNKKRSQGRLSGSRITQEGDCPVAYTDSAGMEWKQSALMAKYCKDITQKVTSNI
jgi:hypothetical protein